MMQRKSVYVGIALVVIIIVVAGFWLLNLQQNDGSSDEIALPLSFESNGFRISYPDRWQHQIPQTNLFFLVSPEVFSQEPGASMVVQRIVRMSGGAETLEELLTIYMDSGPLRSGTSWSVIEDITEIIFDDREAVTVALEGADDAESEQLRSEIILTRADNSIIYALVMTAPLEQWELVQPEFSAILASVELLE